MRTKIRFHAAAFLLVGALAQSPSQAAPDVTARSKVMADATALRAGIADTIANGSIKPAEAINRLLNAASSTGLQIDKGADFAFAATDIGHRLLAAGKPVEAEIFFNAAEQSLVLAVSRTADAKAQDKAQYLQKLALIRANYLNKPAQAKADIEQAIALQPDDKSLYAIQSNLAREKAIFFKDQPKG